MKDYIPKSSKSPNIKKITNEALNILHEVGIPLEGKSERNLERVALAFLAVAGIVANWKELIDKQVSKNLKTRDIIQFINDNYEEKISSGSYDDIRRKDLKPLVVANLIINSGKESGSATNDPTRGYSLNFDFENLIKTYNTKDWEQSLISFNENKEKLSEILSRKRIMEKIPVMLPGDYPLELSLGLHNVLQKEIIEQFLPRFGQNCKVLYIGDTSNKMLHMKKKDLNKLNFFELSHDELPDIIAYNSEKNWLYLIEAVHSSGPMSEYRVLELKKLLKECPAELIFVTAFLTRDIFRKWLLQIAWETEVWIADNPDHLIHFNGHKFLGPFPIQ